MTSIRLFVSYLQLNPCFEFMVQLLCGGKAHVVVNMNICVYQFNAAFLCKGEKKPTFQ